MAREQSKLLNSMNDSSIRELKIASGIKRFIKIKIGPNEYIADEQME